MQPRERREASAFTKFRLLMWKNFLLQSRHRVQSTTEVLVPVLAMALVLILRQQIEPVMEDGTHYTPVRADTLYPSENTLFLLRGLNLTQLSIAYSPQNDLLEDVVRQAMTKLLITNAVELIPLLTEYFPGISNITDVIDISVIESLLPGLIRVTAYNRSQDLSSIYIREEYTRTVLAAVEFPDEWHDVSTLPLELSFALRFPEVPRLSSMFGRGSRSWFTGALFPPFAAPGPRMTGSNVGGSNPGYLNEWFIALQQSLSSELTGRVAGSGAGDRGNFSVHVQRLPHPPYISDLATQFLTLLFPMFVMMSFSYSATNIIRAVTLEKELQLKETMKVMGLPWWLHWLAWFCKQFLFLTVDAVLITIILKVSWFETEAGFREYAVFTTTPWSIVFCFLLIYLCCVITFCFMISGFFSKASTAALFGGVIWFLLYTPALFLSTEASVSLLAQVLLCLSLNTAMAYGFQLMIAEETFGGVQWDTLFSWQSTERSRLLFGHVALMLVLDTLLYMLLALYLEQVLPGPYGTPRKWYFLFTKEFWCENKNETLKGVNVDYSNEVTKEPDPVDLKVGVKLFNVTKVYGGGVMAVDNLSLSMFEDQITVLLGHNGAGKSTTMSMLIGNTPVTHGTVVVAGYDVATQRGAARASLGFCPQHNVLFPELSVAEHLHFFARLKGMRGKELDLEVDSLIHKLELQDKSSCPAGSLSGGQQRALCVGAALSGGARAVLLDEPSAGMDVAARRRLWALLQREARGRTLILTTHFMDEADYLGDRVAILSGGRLQCVGSPYFLKRHYGVGYTLTIVKDENFQLEMCTELINEYIPGTTVKEDRGSEVWYAVSGERAGALAGLLGALERRRDQLRYAHYGLAATTLEDVFMSVGAERPESSTGGGSTHEDASDSTPEEVDCTSSLHNILEESEASVSGGALVWQQVRAVWLKLWLVWSRSPGALALVLLVPAALLSASLLVYTQLQAHRDGINRLQLTMAKGFTLTETYTTYNGSNTSSVGFAASEAFRTLFDNDRMLLRIIDGSDVDEYYYQQGMDAREMWTMRTRVIAGATFSDEGAVAWFSNFCYHDVAISLAALNNALLRAVVPGANLTVYNHPLEAEYDNNRQSNAETTVALLSMQVSVGIGQSISIVSAVYIMFYIRERVSRAKLLQLSAGLGAGALWGGAALYDAAGFSLVCATFLPVLRAFHVTGLSSALELARVYLVMVLYGLSSLPLVYLLSFCFTGAAAGFVALAFVNVLLGVMGPQIVSALAQVSTSEHVATVMDYILQFFPVYSAVTSLQRVHAVSLTQWQCAQSCSLLAALLPAAPQCDQDLVCSYYSFCCLDDNPYLNWSSGISRYLTCMVVTLVVCWTILFVIEYRLIQKLVRPRRRPRPAVTPPLEEREEEDADVRAESERARRLSAAGRAHHNLVVTDLTKYYGDHLAVDQLSFTVGEGECFGLLGANGAGKSTTFKMLLGDETPSAGDATVRGHSVCTQLKQVHQNIGYCPQFDAVFGELTGRETLRLFATLRGCGREEASRIAAALAADLGFTKHLDKRVSTYSGGSRRKLSVGVAAAGRARLALLDEPTTGVDVAAKRQVWRAVRRWGARPGAGVLLTSHSMEECEALCSRLGIMLRGRFRCLGSPQHLKNKFSQGYTLTIKMQEDGADTTQTDGMKEYIKLNFENPKLIEEYHGVLTFYLPSGGAAWSSMFATMERAKTCLRLEHYSISQTTLEQIFLHFTRQQKETAHV